mmetsp:Transcript_76680/g.242451  ORF Transcript_76680/g.242451 Transcript_76680/m.242451 type:complete len:257 (+) Transcript_76680:48-818(+)
MQTSLVVAVPGRPRCRARHARHASRLALLLAAVAASQVVLWLGAHCLGFAGSLQAARLRRAPPVLRGARTARSASPSIEGDEFKAARDRIRRIQLGLGPNDPLPEEEAEEEEAVVPGEAKPRGELDLAEAGVPKEPVVAKVTDDTGVTDASPAKVEDKPPPVADAYAGSMKDVEELKPEEPASKNEGPNFVEGLLLEAGLVTLPSPGEVFQTFGTVLLLVALYTGFVAVVDLGSQTALGRVFEDFYKAARPEAPSL